MVYSVAYRFNPFENRSTTCQNWTTNDLIQSTVYAFFSVTRQIWVFFTLSFIVMGAKRATGFGLF